MCKIKMFLFNLQIIFSFTPWRKAILVYLIYVSCDISRQNELQITLKFTFTYYFDECIEYFQRWNARSNRIARLLNQYYRMKKTCLIYHINYKLHYPKSPIFSSLFLLFASQKVSSLSSLLVFPSLLLSLKHAHCIHLVCMGNTY